MTSGLFISSGVSVATPMLTVRLIVLPSKETDIIFDIMSPIVIIIVNSEAKNKFLALLCLGNSLLRKYLHTTVFIQTRCRCA